MPLIRRIHPTEPRFLNREKTRRPRGRGGGARAGRAASLLTVRRVGRQQRNISVRGGGARGAAQRAPRGEVHPAGGATRRWGGARDALAPTEGSGSARRGLRRRALARFSGGLKPPAAHPEQRRPGGRSSARAPPYRAAPVLEPPRSYPSTAHTCPSQVEPERGRTYLGTRLRPPLLSRGTHRVRRCCRAVPLKARGEVTGPRAALP